MAKQQFIERVFNRGLNILSQRILLKRGQLSSCINFDLKEFSVKRRKGKRAAYQPVASPGTLRPISALARFYHLSAAGVLKKMFLAYNDRMYATSSDWDDDTPALLSQASTTQITAPDETSAVPTLPFEFDGSTVSFTADYLKSAVQSRQWLYVQSDYSTADDTNEIKNIPIRTACGVAPSVGNSFGSVSFAHGLYEPPVIDSADVTATHSGIPYEANLIASTGMTSIDYVSSVCGYRDDNDNLIFAIATGDSSNVVKYVEYSDGAWQTPGTVTGAVISNTTSSSGKSIDMVVDKYGQPHIVYVDDASGANSALMYATKIVGGTWNVSTANSNITGYDNDLTIKLADDGRIHVFMGGYTGGGAGHVTKPRSGSWSSINTIGPGGVNPDPVGALGADVDLDGYLYVAGSTLAGSGTRYVTYTTSTDNGTTWSASAILDSDTNDMGMSTHLIYDRDSDLIHVSYLAESDGAKYIQRNAGGTWGSPAFIGTTGYTYAGVDSGELNMTMDKNGDIYIIVKSEASGSLGIYFYSVSDAAFDSVDIPTTGNLTTAIQPSLWVDTASVNPDNAIIVVRLDSSEVAASLMKRAGYYYKLTATYDDGKLGESGPGAALFVPSGTRIGERVGDVTITVNAPDTTNYYEMGNDASTLNFYRTVRGSTSDGIYYKVGSVDFDYVSTGPNTGWEPDSDFVDNVSDSTLIGNVILDEDAFMPPKYKTACFWKDRMVIGHLKARDTSATEGTELDLEKGGYHPNRIRFSHGFKPDVFPSNYFIDVDIGGESATVRRVIVNKVLDALMVFLEDDTVIVTGDTPLGERGSPFRPQNIPNADGTPAPFSVVSDGEGNVFAWTKAGVQVFEGGSARYITDNTIKPLWNLLDSAHPYYNYRIKMDNISDAAGIYVPGEEKILWSYRNGYGSVNNGILCLDLRRWRAGGKREDGWSIYIGWTISKWCLWKGEGDRFELFGGESAGASLGPWVYRCLSGDDDETGTTSADTVTTAQIAGTLKTGAFDFNRPDRIRKFRNIVINAKADAGDGSDDTSLAVTLDIDDGYLSKSLGTWDPTGGNLKHLTSNIPRDCIGTYGAINIVSTDTDSPDPWELYSIGIETEELPSRVEVG